MDLQKETENERETQCLQFIQWFTFVFIISRNMNSYISKTNCDMPMYDCSLPWHWKLWHTCIMQLTMTLNIMTYVYNAVYYDIKDYDIHV